MSLQSVLRGLCIFKPSCVPFFFSFFFLLGAFIRFSGVHEMHIITVETEWLHVAQSHSLSLLCHLHVMYFLSSLRQDKMFTAVEMHDIDSNVSVFQVEAASGDSRTFLV